MVKSAEERSIDNDVSEDLKLAFLIKKLLFWRGGGTKTGCSLNRVRNTTKIH